jgi:hypothetical protein
MRCDALMSRSAAPKMTDKSLFAAICPTEPTTFKTKSRNWSVATGDGEGQPASTVRQEPAWRSTCGVRVRASAVN